MITDKLKSKMIDFIQTTNNIGNKEHIDLPVKSRCKVELN